MQAVKWTLTVSGRTQARHSAQVISGAIVRHALELDMLACEQHNGDSCEYVVHCDKDALKRLTTQAVSSYKQYRWRLGALCDPTTLQGWKWMFGRWIAFQKTGSTWNAPGRAVTDIIDLDEPITYALWLEFINEFPERREAWSKALITL